RTSPYPTLFRSTEPVDGSKLHETTYGRILINSVMPEDFPWVEAVLTKSDLRNLIEVVIDRYPRSVVAEMLDGIKELGFKFATKAGLTIGLEDVRTPPDKQKILAEYEEQAQRIQDQYL